MKKITKIVAATDFSDAADLALGRATMLAYETGSALTFLHVFNGDVADRLLQRPVDHTGQPNLGELTLKELQVRQGEIMTTYGQPGQAAQCEVRSGSVLKTIKSMINEYHADLLVCAARGQSLFRHHLLGSIALRMLHASQSPVLIVKTPPESIYLKVLVAVDFGPRSEDCIEVARTLATRASIALLNVIESPFENMMHIATIDEVLLDQYRKQAETESVKDLYSLRDQTCHDLPDQELISLHGDAAQTLLDQARDRGCDLIVIGRDSVSALEERLIGSVTKRVVEGSPIDVLVV